MQTTQQLQQKQVKILKCVKCGNEYIFDSSSRTCPQCHGALKTKIVPT